MKLMNINFNFIANNYINNEWSLDETIDYMTKRLEEIIYTEVIDILKEK